MPEHQTGSGVRISLSAKHKVVCVHDREKRLVVTEQQVAQLGLDVGILYKPGIHKLHECSCCENLFVATQVEPKYCSVCEKPLVHALGGPLPEPKGVVG